jgi:Protein of unknown function (DUF2585)
MVPRRKPQLQTSSEKVLAITLLLLTLAAVAEFAMGRRTWGIGGIPGIWSGDINSEHNSQFLFDPYTLTHVTHGVILYALMTLVFARLPVASRLLIAIGLECGWEVFENTSFIIERYRAETVSLNYYGDSIVNSLCDVIACIAGFLLASRLPTRVTILATTAIEILLAVWTRDNLTLNIIMLIHPSEVIRAWQLGR